MKDDVIFNLLEVNEVTMFPNSSMDFEFTVVCNNIIR